MSEPLTSGDTFQLNALFLNSEQEERICGALARVSVTQLSIDIDAAGSLRIEKLDVPRTAPIDMLEPVPRPSTASHPHLKSSEIGTCANLIANLEQWLSHLLALKAVEERKSKALKACWPDQGGQHIFSAAAESLFELINGLQTALERLRSESAEHEVRDEATSEELASLWQEMRQAEGPAAETEVRERVVGALRGSKLNRSERRAAFKSSPYSYRATSFRGRFVAMSGHGFGTEREVQEPQMPDLSDEVSANVSFQRSPEPS